MLQRARSPNWPQIAKREAVAYPLHRFAVPLPPAGEDSQISAAGSSAISFRKGAAWSMRPVIVRWSPMQSW
jgi:hypothetical protein